MQTKKGAYQNVYIERDEKLITLKDDVTAFCEKYIKKHHLRNWDWSTRDFENPKNDPTIEEARSIGGLVFKDLNSKIPTDVDLSSIKNVEAIKAYLNPKSKYEEFNMDEFAYALKVELEHGRVKDVNVTNNHPFLTAMIVLAHMSESLTYYKRLKVMETEAEIYEITRKIEQAKKGKEKLYKDLFKAEKELNDAKKGLVERLEKMEGIPVLKDIGD
jgi:cell division protein FtsL